MYFKVGKGKYILRLCRICGEEKTFASDLELTNHIAVGHPVDQFGEKLDDSDDDQPQSSRATEPQSNIEVKQEPTDDIEELASNVQKVPATPTRGRDGNGIFESNRLKICVITKNFPSIFQFQECISVQI